MKKNYATALYTISFSLICINLIISLMYLDFYFSGSPLPEVGPYPMVSYVINLVHSTSTTDSLSIIFDILSLTSFLLMWVATAALLRQYRHRIGHFKYLLLLGMPLIYYIYPFQNYFGDPLFPLLQSYSVSLSSVYILIFSATRQVGVFLFSLAFLTASSLVYDDRIRKSLCISAIGMTILFGSIEITPLQYHVHPPFGLITEAFIPIGSYLLFVGIFISTKGVSRDADLRRGFYKKAESQLSLLRAIGVSEMEKELLKQVKSLENKHLREISDLNGRMVEEENVKEIVREVLNELYYSKPGNRGIQE